MALLAEYHRPDTLDEAVALLARGDRHLRPLAGGTTLVGQLETRAVADLDGVVDLRSLGLDTLVLHGSSLDGTLAVGAMVTLSDFAAHPVVNDLAAGLLRQAAQGEGPLNLRDMATVGGVVAAAAPDSEVYAALLALEAQVECYDGQETQTTPLAAWGGQTRGAHSVITGVQIPLHARTGALARVARTPSDRPIVAAVGAGGDEGTRYALCGVGPRPLLATDDFDPPDDYKGSAAYRRAMADVLLGRVRRQIEDR